MRLAVLSPLNRSGCSVVSTIIAQSLAATQDCTVTLAYTSRTNTLPVYLNLLDEVEDVTRSVSLLSKLTMARSISDEEIQEYLVKVDTNFYILNTVSKTVTDAEALNVQKHVFKHSLADVTICDISESIDHDNTQELFTVADAVCIVLNPDEVSIESYQIWRESDFWPKDKAVFAVVNRYGDEIVGVRPFAKRCGISARDLCKLHYNPYIVKACNERFLSDIVPYAINNDVRLLNIKSDIKELMSWMTHVMLKKLKWDK